MATERYEIEFQGSHDGRDWTPHPFHYKLHAPTAAPGIYAPYHPRFGWNLWFASLGQWKDNLWVIGTEELLLKNDPSVLSLFKSKWFPGVPPLEVRAVLRQHWFTNLQAKRKTGKWWKRKYLGFYGPVLQRTPDGTFAALE